MAEPGPAACSPNHGTIIPRNLPPLKGMGRTFHTENDDTQSTYPRGPWGKREEPFMRPRRHGFQSQAFSHPRTFAHAVPYAWSIPPIPLTLPLTLLLPNPSMADLLLLFLIFYVRSQRESLTHSFYSFIHSFKKCVLHAYHVPGTMLSARQTQHLTS